MKNVKNWWYYKRAIESRAWSAIGQALGVAGMVTAVGAGLYGWGKDTGDHYARLELNQVINELEADNHALVESVSRLEHDLEIAEADEAMCKSESQELINDCEESLSFWRGKVRGELKDYCEERSTIAVSLEKILNRREESGGTD